MVKKLGKHVKLPQNTSKRADIDLNRNYVMILKLFDTLFKGCQSEILKIYQKGGVHILSRNGWIEKRVGTK